VLPARGVGAILGRLVVNPAAIACALALVGSVDSARPLQMYQPA
jgi:hypothetical protein